MTDDEANAAIKQNDLAGLEPLADQPVAPAHVISSIALNLALKYHDIGTVQDGVMYQQMKLEGKNLMPLHLDMVLETAVRMERWLLHSNERIAKIVFDALEGATDADPAGGEPETAP